MHTIRMCEVCSDLLSLLDKHDDRVHSSAGLQLNKDEILSVLIYVCAWPQRQCMCCYKDLKNIERINNIVQVIISTAIRMIQTLPDDFEEEKRRNKVETSEDKTPPSHVSGKEEQKDGEENELTTEGDNGEEGDEDVWILEEKDRLLQFVTKVFLMNFPLYTAYKHLVHTSLEELSQHETSALNNYCEITDPDVPLLLLRNVCFFCDSNGIPALRQCFEKATPESLPFTVVHTLITVITNLRLWMNITTVMQYIVPLRTAVIKYMCQLSDKELRVAGTQNITELMWAAMKEPLETQFTFDRDGLDLAFKYFTSSTLTLRLAGITQINNQINLYNESCNNESVLDVESVGNQLSQWLLDTKIIELIFGPNLHVELIKQSQVILTFLAMEGRVTNEHIDCIWAASQLKHCSKQVYEVVIPLIKNLELSPVQHLLSRMSALEPTSHTESTLYLASALIKCIWNTYALGQVSCLPQRPCCGQGKHTCADMSSVDGHQHNIDVCESCVDPNRTGDSPVHLHHDEQKCDIKGDESSDGADSHHECGSHHNGHCCMSHSEEQSVSEDISPETEKAIREMCHQHGIGQKLQHAGRRARVHIMGLPTGRVAQMSPGSGGNSDSDADYSETSDEEEEEEDECGIQNHSRLVRGQKSLTLRMKAQQLLRKAHAQRSMTKGIHARRRPAKPVHESGSEEDVAMIDESEDEESEGAVPKEKHHCCHGDTESEECHDSDEELLHHAKMVHMKNMWPVSAESEDTSDFDEEEDEESQEERMAREARLQIFAHKALIKQRAQNQRKAARKKKVIKPIQDDQDYEKKVSSEVKEDESSQAEPSDATQQGTKISVTNEKLDDTASTVEKNKEKQEQESTIAGDDKRNTEENTKADDDVDTEVFDCTAYVERMKAEKQLQQLIESQIMNDILSPDNASGNSSRMSAKSEKNMADFEGEEVLSEEELLNINAHMNLKAASSSHPIQHTLASMASMYHTHIDHDVLSQCCWQKDVLEQGDPRLDGVCQPGSTLLWDLLQDDKAHLLPEGLAVDAEKALCTLVCFTSQRCIKLRFIEACISNVAQNSSEVISLRLLPKIFNSFQQYRAGIDIHTVTMWADRDLNMMENFFTNLVHYTRIMHGSISGSSDVMLATALYSHRECVQVRLLFLAFVFSALGSPDTFRLSLAQVDTLWTCLAMDPECADECLNWFLIQAKSKEQHSMGLDTFKYLFLHKMPHLQAESMSMTGLNLLQQLCHLTRVANATSEAPLSEEQICGMVQLWSIALNATNTDVSMAAIQFINTYYINYGMGLLEKEAEFVEICMSRLTETMRNIDEFPEQHLIVIQRGLLLLKSHLEAFRKRYAYHLRTWQISGTGINSHQASMQQEKSVIRIMLQPAGISRKSTLELLMTDLVSEFRAEVTHWWHLLQTEQQQQQQQAGSSPNHGGPVMSSVLGAMLGDGPVRMITLGQEITVDMDEKTLAELQFKDMQLVLVSVGASRQPRKMDDTIPCAYLPAPSRDRLPMRILLEEPHFGQLLVLLEQLSQLQFSGKIMESQDRHSLQTKARVLSRSVWELLMLLPTSHEIQNAFETLVSPQCGPEGSEQKIDWNSLLDQDHPHKLLYSLQIIEALATAPYRQRTRSLSQSGGGDACVPSSSNEAGSSSTEKTMNTWSKQFVGMGGLKHMLQIFLSGALLGSDADSCSQWTQECLASLLRLIYEFSVEPSDSAMTHEDLFDIYESPRKRMRKQKFSQDKILIPQINQSVLSMLDVDSVLKILMKILYNAALPSDLIQAGSWGRTEVVHYALCLLVTWAHSCIPVQVALCSSPDLSSWLKRIIIEAPEPYIRRESCMGLYRLCLGRSSVDKETQGSGLLQPMLSQLLTLLPTALLIKPRISEIMECVKEKEPYGPGSRDYFWLLCRFTESLHKQDDASGLSGAVDLNELASTLSDHIIQRPPYEAWHGYEDDDALIGLLNVSAAVMKHNPPYKVSPECQNLLKELFFCLFALPSPQKRNLPKCKSHNSRSAVYDLLVEMCRGSVPNYSVLHGSMLKQHTKDVHAPYLWDYWPHEDVRSKCGYVGLTNLGATCYMATCMQHLYMIPQARASVLQAQCSDEMEHEGTLVELQKMFAYLMESERKAYNPQSFCKAYTMDKQPLNTGEQKDMTEFFTDLISKMEEMSPALKKLVKTLFGGVITNNVVSLDCSHVSRTVEEFYTVRCQVTDMKNLYESLDEVTVKDMLEGDNMYTCSKCQKKVRAEKRACFKKLPKILCFNTMRYTFNMVTMLKEKVNTHFSFPLRLDMSTYMETHLMGPDKLKDDDDEDDNDQRFEDVCDSDDPDDLLSEYELIGVTVHTGTADGGHYYSFIRDRLNKTASGVDKWYLFNDAEVKPFDPGQIASECFGGEMTSKTYDTVTEKFMDFSFEKTNSAYMLFYERLTIAESSPKLPAPETSTENTDGLTEICHQGSATEDNQAVLAKFHFDLSKDLAEWIWGDNMQFLQDKNIFEHTYFGFMWQVCGYIPTTLPKDESSGQIMLMACQLSTSFVLETLIHAKEKPTMLQWIELLTKQFNSCQAACEWFLNHMSDSDWWPQQILIKCPNQTVRQMFQRLLIHVINQIRPSQVSLYLKQNEGNERTTCADGEDADMSELGNQSCVTQFIRKMLCIIEHGVQPQSRFLTEYFAFLLEFAKMGQEECMFLLHINAISTMVAFYMGQKAHENYVEILSDDEEEDDVVTVLKDKYKPQALDKMISLIALLGEKSRGDDHQLHLCDRDLGNLSGGKGLPFLFCQIRDGINIRQTCNLIFSLCRWNDALAMAVIQMVFGAIKRLSPVLSASFFKLLSMLVEFAGGPPGMPPFTQYVLHAFWELTDYCPQQCLEWLASQVQRNRLAQTWVLSQMDTWVEQYLIAHSNVRVRNAASYLLVCLVPSAHFRQTFRSARSMLSPHKELSMSADSINALHEVYEHLLGLLERARLYVDPQTHGTAKLMSYFTLMSYCLISKAEKLMFGRYFPDLWQLFQPKMSEPPIPVHHNKQALLVFWYQVCVDCPENVALIVSNPHVCKNIAFNHILADHEDQEVMLFNRCMLPAYYSLLRLCCQQSTQFTLQLSQHQNIQWAFKNISPYPAQYTAAVDELFKMMRLMASHPPRCSEEEAQIVSQFRQDTIQMYLQHLDARSNWQTLVMALKILVDSSEERLLLIYQRGPQMLTEAFHTLHVMYHEATACHVSPELVDLLNILFPVLRDGRHHLERKGPVSLDVKSCLFSWRDRMEFVKKLLTLLNSFAPPEIRITAIDVLKEMVLIFQGESLSTLVPILTQAHVSFQDNNLPVSVGPYFPRRGQKSVGVKSTLRPTRPEFQMLLHSNQLQAAKDVDDAYDQALKDYYTPYHILVDLLSRVAVNQQNVTPAIVNLSALVAFEGVPLHMPYFAKLWCEIYQSEQVDKSCIELLCNSNFLIDYIDAVLLDERLSLNNHIIYQFFCNFFPKVQHQVLNDQGRSLLDSLVASVSAERAALDNIRTAEELTSIASRINGDVRALLLIFSVQPPDELNPVLLQSLHHILGVCRRFQQDNQARSRQNSQSDKEHVEQKPAETSNETDPESMETEHDGDVVVGNNKQSVPDSGETTQASSEQPADMGEAPADTPTVNECEENQQSRQESLEQALPTEQPQSDQQQSLDDTDTSATEIPETSDTSQKAEPVVQVDEGEPEKPNKKDPETRHKMGATPSKRRRVSHDEKAGPSSATGEEELARDVSNTNTSDDESHSANLEEKSHSSSTADDSVTESSSKQTPSTSSGEIAPTASATAKNHQRDKPGIVDVLIRQIESLFSVLGNHEAR